jgi:phosphohistidine swiveling domain-containing protein
LILVVGAFELVPLLLVLVLAVALTLPAGLAWGAVVALFHHPVVSGVVSAVGVAGIGLVVERAVRKRQAGHAVSWVETLDSLGACAAAPLDAVGGKALGLAHLARLGAPVPDAVVLTSALVERILAATAGGKGVDRVWPVLPTPARRALEAFLAGAKGKLVVRASFTDHGAKHSYAGVFPAVRDIDPTDHDRLIAAVLTVVASADDAIGREYRRRRGAGAGVARAVVVQRQIDAEVSGTVGSRGPGGRADSVTIDFARRRSPVRSHLYDLVEGKARVVVGEENVDTPAWVHRLAVLAVTLEEELGGPVNVEFALEQDQPYVLDARPVVVAERKTWIHAPPLDVTGERLPTFAQELRGGLPLVRRVLSETLVRAGASGEIRDDEVRYVDGLVYFDAEVLRRALARLGADVLLRGGLRATLRSIAPVRKRPLPAVPTVTEITPGAWQALRGWHGRHLLGAAQVRLELVAREWLIRTLLRLIDGSGTSVEERRGHPALRFLLARRVREATEEAARQRTVLEHAETELGGAVARVLALGAAAWNAMFKGDRHLHATLEEIDAWHEDLGQRDALEAQWRTRRIAFDQRKEEAIQPRVHRPALPEAQSDSALATSLAPGGMTGRPTVPKIQGFGVVAGKAAGPAVLYTGVEREVGVGAILMLADPRTEMCPQVYDARGIILLSGGLVSPVALLAAELGVPTVLCPAARGCATLDVVIDGTSGTITVKAR